MAIECCDTEVAFLKRQFVVLLTIKCKNSIGASSNRAAYFNGLILKKPL